MVVLVYSKGVSFLDDYVYNMYNLIVALKSVERSW